MIDYDGFANWLEVNYPGLYEDWCEDDSVYGAEQAYDYMRRVDRSIIAEWVDTWHKVK